MNKDEPLPSHGLPAKLRHRSFAFPGGLFFIGR